MRKEDAAVTGAAFAAGVRKALEPLRDPKQAAPMERYLRGRFPFLGVKTGPLTAAMRPLIHDAKPFASEAFLRAAAGALWKFPEREYHHAAAFLLYRREKLLTPVSLPWLRELVETKSWWDSVDALATRCVGPLVARRPELREQMDVWSVDANFWVRRVAIVHQLGFRERTDKRRLFRYCESNAGDAEFFIRKAIGWALRQYSKTDARAVRRFVEDHPELSNLSKREALKHCS